jgi:alcohol dehydrogenase
MRAALLTAYGRPLEMAEVPDPALRGHGAIIEVEATGICLSDWHAWMGHEELPRLPHVLGHEMAGTVAEVGPDVTGWRPGDRVTLPFSAGCGRCASCLAGHLNTCDRGFTPGFSHWGSFAQFVAVAHADVNLVRIPEGLDWAPAAALGCRFVTAFRAVVDRGRLVEGEWLAVHGCGGVGLSAVMIASALGARVVAIDINAGALAMADELGAEAVIDASSSDAAAAVMEVTDGGAHVSIDAVGRMETALASIASVRKHGRHVQVGLLLGDQATPAIPMEPVIMGEIDILGSRGMPATDYPRVLGLIESGLVDPARLVTGTVPLDRASSVLERMGDFAGPGVTVIDRF